MTEMFQPIHTCTLYDAILLSPTCHNNKKLPGPHVVLDQVHPSRANFYTDPQKPEGLRKIRTLAAIWALQERIPTNRETFFMYPTLKVLVQCPIHGHISGVVVVW